MDLWVDKHRPKVIEELTYHPNLTQQINQLAKMNDLPHLLIYGPCGAGKKTRVSCLLKSIFGDSVEKVHIDMRQFSTPSNKKIDISVMASNYHMELNPSDVGNNDRVVIQTLIKEIAQTQQVDFNSARKFKVIVISEADQLSKAAQQALRRTMEKYMSSLRLVLVATTTTRILAPVRSRCLLLRVPAPTESEVIEVLQGIAEKEEIDLPSQFAKSLATSSDRNLRKAILLLEAAVAQSYPLNPSSKPPLPDWEFLIKNIASQILKDQSPAILVEIRAKLYELLAKCIPGSLIVKTLALEIVTHVDDVLKLDIIRLASEIEQRLNLGQKTIVHLECYVANVMSIYKRHMLQKYS